MHPLLPNNCKSALTINWTLYYNDNSPKPFIIWKDIIYLTDSSLNLKAILDFALHSNALEWPVCPTSWQIAENNKEYS